MDESQLLGRRIRELRKKRCWTQEELAEAAGLHFKFLGRVERGTTNSTLRVLKKIAKALEVPVSELFRYEIQAPDPKQIRKQLADEIRRSSDSDLLLLRRVYDLIRDRNPKS